MHFELIDIFADDYFTFKKGDLNLRMIIKGTINKPIVNGFVVINDSEIDIYSNIIKKIAAITYEIAMPKEIPRGPSQMAIIETNFESPLPNASRL